MVGQGELFSSTDTCPALCEDAYRVERRYVEDTAILETRFVTEQWTVRLTDFFVAVRDPHAHFYGFISMHPTHKLVRLLELENGADAVIDLRVAARSPASRRPPAWRWRLRMR